jgi:glutamine amidotransferase
MIAIVDYGLGNIESVKYALDRLGEESVVTDQSEVIAASRGVILPGVGAFGRAMENLCQLRLIDALHEAAGGGRPFLGICLGLQLLFAESTEHGRHRGLGVLAGSVERFAADLTVPHMGWNELCQERPSVLFEGVKDPEWFYFAHSYRAVPADPGVVIGTTDYGGPYASAVQQGSVLAVQFHPEKSGPSGLKMLENFCRLCR